MFEHRGLNYDNWGKSIQTVYRQGEKLSVKIILGVVAVSVKIL